MSDAQVVIRPLIAQDIPRVVEIFRAQFPDLSWTRLGRNFIHKFIDWHFKYHPELAIVAEDDSGLIGFILGATGGHREYYQRLLRFAFPEFLSGSLSHPWLVFRPSFLTLWLEFFRSLRSTQIKSKEIGISKTGEKKGILSFVAVTEAAQRRGIGTSLKQAFEEAAFQSGLEVLSSYTEINNYAARRLNGKRGWKQVREDPRRKMVYFSKRLDKSS
jgi:ribosomal protein S18 acetylase RimI-like enzyme